MKQDIENIIKKNFNSTEISERIVIEYANITGREDTYRAYVRKASDTILSQINTSLIADEVLKVMVEKIESIRIIEERDYRDFRVTPSHPQIEPLSKYSQGFNASLDILKSLIHLSPNKENK